MTVKKIDTFPLEKIIVKDVTISRGNRVILDISALDIEVGKTIFIRGETGSGKTTLLKLLALAIKPDQGTIFWDDRPISQWSEYYMALLRRNIGYLPQNNDILPWLDIKNNAILPLYAKSLDDSLEKNALKWLKNMELYERTGEKAGKLSGGQIRRLLMVRTLCHDPGLILLDEPLNGLDDKWREKVKNVIKELSDAGKTIIITGHHNPDFFSPHQVISVKNATTFEEKDLKCTP